MLVVLLAPEYSNASGAGDPTLIMIHLLLMSPGALTAMVTDLLVPATQGFWYLITIIE